MCLSTKTEKRLKEHRFKTFHLDECNGHIEYEVAGWDKDLTPISYKTERKCESCNIPFSMDYEIYHVNVGECVMNKFNLTQRDVVEHFLTHENGREIVKFRNDPPKWDGEDFVYEIVYYTNGWTWCIETDFDKVPNVFHNEEVLEAMRDSHGSKLHENVEFLYSNLVDWNMYYLKRCEFVSARANNYCISQADINKMLNKLKKKTNGINKQRASKR